MWVRRERHNGVIKRNKNQKLYQPWEPELPQLDIIRGSLNTHLLTDFDTNYIREKKLASGVADTSRLS